MFRCIWLLLEILWKHRCCLLISHFKIFLCLWWILKIFLSLRHHDFAFYWYLPFEGGSSAIPLIEQAPNALRYCKHLISDYHFLSLRDLEIQGIVVNYSRLRRWAIPQELDPPLDPVPIYEVQVLTIVASLFETNVLLPLHLFPWLSPAEVSRILKVSRGKAKQLLLDIL